MRKTVCYTVFDIQNFKNNLLEWSRQYDEVAWLDSNGHTGAYSSFDGLLAVDGLTGISTDARHGFSNLAEYQSQVNDWIFGYLSYDLKNDTEFLSSENLDGLEFPDLYFFQPKKIIRIQGNEVDFIYLNMVADAISGDYDVLSKGTLQQDKSMATDGDVHVKMRIFKDEYFSKVNQMLGHIHQGDIYEANFCQEFYAEDLKIDAVKTYKKLNAISKPPFATYLKLFDKYLMCASPERYLKKIGSKIISQPIKGTAPRSKDKEIDTRLIQALQTDEKERSENIMIVDLVRNDLSKSALRGSVVVEELCEVYSFEQVHQMISTVSAIVPTDKNVVSLVKENFPMGSMTGAPKVSAMKIIEDLESFKRGLYSGAVGYFTPKADFDFNVVIRSILYNETKKYVSYAVGSAITAKSVPEKEYQECLLKAKAMRQVLEE
ncbi:anthranilate synthase component I family protein [Maribacter antarcticus]|uniref:anthranilate synthase component I family protein n=1 Tax=Maribacter antarcticus TaxID=505250 RepID=UPI00047B3EA1|nr:anthranilate synthase component I family protein [Maribacter antarcticus]